MTTATSVPVIDMSLDDSDLIPLIADACSSFGFFQIINVEDEIACRVVDDFKAAMREYFALPYDQKLGYKRQEQNARGYFDDELTKQKT
jgi:isopenicillin N synthase-like dioxygenase